MKTSCCIFRFVLLSVISLPVHAHNGEDEGEVRRVPAGDLSGYLVNGRPVKTHNGYVPLPVDWDYENEPIIINKVRSVKDK